MQVETSYQIRAICLIRGEKSVLAAGVLHQMGELGKNQFVQRQANGGSRTWHGQNQGFTDQPPAARLSIAAGPIS